MITPNTNIRLLKVPFEIARKNQLTFARLNAQTTYFLSLPHLEYDNTTYQRANNTIRFEAPIDDILTYNYVMYKNDSYSDKWFYAYVTKMEYKNDNTTDITIQTDTFQTWQFDIVYNTMFVEREHVNNDTIGLHTIPEDLNIGEVIQEGAVIEDTSYTNEYGYWIAVQSNWLIKDNSTGYEIIESDKGTQFAGVTIYNNVVYGTQILLIKINSLSDFANLYLLITRTNNDGHINDIQNIFIVPNLAISELSLTLHTAKFGDDLTFNFYTMPYDLTPKKFNTTITKNTSFTDFTPKNNKCFVYPYNYLYVTNNQGSNNIYRYENFSTTNCIFENQFALSVGGSGKVVPKDYKGMTTNDDESLTLGKYPTCAWSSDAFTNWLTQNAVNIPVSIGASMLSLGLSSFTFGVSEALGEAGALATASYMGNQISTTASTISGVIGKFYEASLLPNIESGKATGDISFANNKNVFSFRKMRAKTEYLRAIDDFFSLFGYKINRVKTPNITGRTNWNYVKTIDCNITGEIPQEDLQELKDMFNNGVTFWHNPSTFLDYSQSNAIVT